MPYGAEPAGAFDRTRNTAVSSVYFDAMMGPARRSCVTDQRRRSVPAGDHLDHRMRAVRPDQMWALDFQVDVTVKAGR
jgi:hypothetical protein